MEPYIFAFNASTDEQLEYSPDAQRKALFEYAARNDIYISDEHIFIDEGISGRRADKRPQFQKMIASAKSKPKPFDIILVHKFDRFARSREDSIVYKSMLARECGVKVISITEELGDDKTSVILEAMLEAMAEYYSLNLAEEVKKGMTIKAERGELQTKAMFGYTVDSANNKLVIQPEEAEIVKMIFNDYINLVSIAEISDKINAMGVKTKLGSKFRYTRVAYIINNPVYTGKLKWNPKGSTGNMHIDLHSSDSIITKGMHEPIVTDEQFKAATELYRLRRRKFSKRNSYPKYWLVGFVKCSACGSSLSYATQKNAMQCHQYANRMCNVSHSINVIKLENALKKIIENDISAKNENIEYAGTGRKQEKIDFQAQINKARQKLDRANDAYLNGVYDLEYLKKVKADIESEIALLTEQQNNYGENKKPEPDVRHIAKNAINMFDENLSY